MCENFLSQKNNLMKYFLQNRHSHIENPFVKPFLKNFHLYPRSKEAVNPEPLNP